MSPRRDSEIDAVRRWADARFCFDSISLNPELRAVGSDVVEVEVDNLTLTVQRQRLEALARANDALAALHLWHAGDAGEAEVWLVDRVTRKTSIRHVDVADVPATEADEILAVRVVELLRASLLEIHQPTSRGEVSPPPSIERFVPSSAAAASPPVLRAAILVAGRFRCIGHPGGPGCHAGPASACSSAGPEAAAKSPTGAKPTPPSSPCPRPPSISPSPSSPASASASASASA